MSLKVSVECYSGYKADERPVRFTLAVPAHPDQAATPSARTYEVLEVLDQWYDPESIFYKVRADDGNLYILRHDQTEDTWTLDSFRRGCEPECGKVKGRKSNVKS